MRFVSAAKQQEEDRGAVEDNSYVDKRVEYMAARWFSLCCLELRGATSSNDQDDPSASANANACGLVSFDSGQPTALYGASLETHSNHRCFIEPQTDRRFVDNLMWSVELSPTPSNLLVALWQILGLQAYGVPATWAEASEKCEAMGMGRVSLSKQETHGRWIIDCGEAGARLRVVVRESLASKPAVKPSSLLVHSSDTVGHCYTLRPAPATNHAEVESCWRNEIAPKWVAAWASGRLSPLQQSLVPRLVDGGSLMMDAARTQAQAVEAVMHAPLDQVGSFHLGISLRTSTARGS